MHSVSALKKSFYLQTVYTVHYHQVFTSYVLLAASNRIYVKESFSFCAKVLNYCHHSVIEQSVTLVGMYLPTYTWIRNGTIQWRSIILNKLQVNQAWYFSERNIKCCQREYWYNFDTLHPVTVIVKCVDACWTVDVASPFLPKLTELGIIVIVNQILYLILQHLLGGKVRMP